MSSLHGLQLSASLGHEPKKLIHIPCSAFCATVAFLLRPRFVASIKCSNLDGARLAFWDDNREDDEKDKEEGGEHGMVQGCIM